MTKNLESLSALALSKLIHDKEISPLELTTFFADRISKIDLQLVSFAHVSIETALESAKIKTEILGKTQDTSELPPFFGIPTAIKDLYAVKGMPVGYGNNFINDHISDYDSGIVSTIKQAGFIIIGKTEKE